MEKLMQDLKAQVKIIKEAKNDHDVFIAKAQACNIIADIFESEAKEAVKMIEAKPKTTQDHYGDYMNLLGSFKGLYRIGMIQALRKAGASHGLDGAINIVLGQ